MADNNCYDVTQWPEGNPYKDVGAGNQQYHRGYQKQAGES